MNGRLATNWLAVVATILAVAVPGAFLAALAEPDRRSAGLAVPPFGTVSLLIAHLVAVLLLGLQVARGLSGSWLFWVGLGGVLPCAVAWLGSSLSHTLAFTDAGFLTRVLVRTALALVLVVPWLVVVVRWGGSMPPGRPGVMLLAVAVLAAVLPPAVYADQLRVTRAGELASRIETGRWVQALSVNDLRIDLGDPTLTQGRTAAQQRRWLSTAIARLEPTVSEPLPATAGTAARIERAFALIQLDRLVEASRMLEPLVDGDPDAALLQGSLARERGEWTLAAQVYRGALTQLRGEDASSREGAATAYDGLAEVEQRLGRPEAAAQLYREAAQRWPDRAAYFLVQQGRLATERGRPAAALAHYAEALTLDPALQSQVHPLIQQIRVQTPACLFVPRTTFGLPSGGEPPQ